MLHPKGGGWTGWHGESDQVFDLKTSNYERDRNKRRTCAESSHNNETLLVKLLVCKWVSCFVKIASDDYIPNEKVSACGDFQGRRER